MITLIFNNENLYPVAVEHMSYNVSYERPGYGARNENLHAVLANGMLLGDSMSNLNHFENVVIEKVTIQKEGVEDRVLAFGAPMHLTGVDSYVTAESETASFNMQYISMTESEQSGV